MARKIVKARPPQANVKDKDKDKDRPQPAAAEPAAPTPAAANPEMTKAEAVRRALAAGFGGPKAGSTYIREQFGIEVAPQHFSAVKSLLKGRTGGAGATKGRTGAGAGASQGVDGYLAPPPNAPVDGADLIDALETMKPLIAQYGADRVKRIVDLLG